VPTFLGAHEVPREYKGKKSQFVRDLVIDWIPEVAKRGLAEFCDVFCDQGVFTSKDSAIILYVAREHGLKPKIHSDEFKAIGGTELAAQIGAHSADHLAAITAKGIKALKGSSTVATLLPATCLTLDFERWPPARELIAEGIPVALATDCNPGSSMTESLPLVMSLACNRMRMTPQETLSAVTLNGAAALDRAHLCGSLQIDKFADISFWNATCLEEIPYHMNGNLCVGTIIGGDEWIQSSMNLSPYQ
ncbi:MAG: amidohydrolase family protein, partial [Planctomycetota bacterium]